MPEARTHLVVNRSGGFFAKFGRQEILVDIVLEGVTPGDDRAAAIAQLAPFAEAGVNWWIESMWGDPHDGETLRKRIRQGPPRP